MTTIDLATVLGQLDIRITDDGEHEVWGLCPGHERRLHRSDHKPSWSMNRDTHVHSCFSCGYSGTLRSLVREQLGLDPFRAQVWLLEHGVRGLPTASPVFHPSEHRPVPEPLSGFVDPPQRALERRHLEPWAAAHYGVRWDKEGGAWILPVYTPEGEYLGYQRKSRDRVRNLPPGMAKSKAVFGLNKLPPGTSAILVESPLDAVRLYSLGIEGGVASMGAFVSRAQMRLLLQWVDGERLILALDNDPVGRDRTVRLWREWRKLFTMWVFNYGEAKGKDPGELSAEEVRWGLEHKIWTEGGEWP